METQKAHQRQHTLPLFPLGVVLLPQMILPLHIFEERYKIMINECVDQNKAFGIVHFDGQQMRKVGCTARITEISRKYEDGRMDIVTQGEQRFFIECLDESREYLQSNVLFIDDKDEPLSDEDLTLAREGVNLLRRLDQVSGIMRDYDQLADLDLGQMSFLIPSTEGFTADERQRFLEMTSSRNRLRKGMEVLEKVIERERINQKVAKIIGGNGDVKAFLAEQNQRGHT
jgi:Lon protease-like protein